MPSLQKIENAVDPHHHFWSPKTHDWLEKVAESGHPAGPFRSVLNYHVEDYAQDAATFNVTKSVHVQAHFTGEPVEETKWLQEISDKSGFPTGIVAYADLTKPDVDSVLAAHCQYSNMRGIRQMIDYHPTNEQWRQCPHDKFMTDDAWLTGLQLLPKHNLSFDMQIHVPQMQVASEVVRRNPNVQFMLNHAGFPYTFTDDAIQSWKEGMSALSRHDNIAVKLSGFNMYYKEWNKQVLHPLLEYAINTFSVGRCMFASNFPVDKINGKYADLLGTYLEVCGDLGYSQANAEQMFRDNALRLYRL
eukprot:scpid57607/ scgid11354/ Uncharacterized protein y4mH